MTHRWRGRARHGVLAALAAAVVLALGPSTAGAQSGPRITLDRAEVAPGQPILVTVEDFDSPFVNLVVCGNLGYRGASDCNVTAGVSKETLAGGRPKLVQLIAHPPPAPCPCIVRATASAGGDFAVAPIVITGHPVGDPVGVPDGPLVQVEVEARRSDGSLWSRLRSALGGPTRYEATVSVRNTTTGPLTKVALSGSVGHWLDDDAATLELDPPGAIEPGRTHTQQVVAEVPAPSVGDYTFEVVVSGAGSSVTEVVAVRNKPVLLYLLAALLVGDITMVLTRWMSKRRARRAAEAQRGLEESDDHRDDLGAGWAEPASSQPLAF